MIVTITETLKDGTRRAYRKNYDTGEEVEIDWSSTLQVRTGEQGFWQLSSSCGVPLKQQKQAEKLDHELGVPVDYVRRGEFVQAGFSSPAQKRKWLRAHKWVDHDAGYRDPTPGDFVGR